MQPATHQSRRVGRQSLVLSLTLGTVLTGCAPKSAMKAPLPVWGDSVRVTIGDHRAVHEFRELRGDVLMVQNPKGGGPLTIPLADVYDLEVVVGNNWAGNVIGLGVIGLLVGTGIGAWLASSTSGGSCEGGDPCGIGSLGFSLGRAISLTVVGGGVGMALGSAVGSAMRPEPIWAPVDSTALDVHAYLVPDGFGIQLSWRP